MAGDALTFRVAFVVRWLLWVVRFVVIWPLATMALMALFVLWKDNTTPVAAERMGERLRGIAENVFAYATGQRDAERAGHEVESAGAALERADRTLEPVIQREQEIRDERLIQEREHELSLERERQLEIQERTLDGPSLGW